MAREDDSQYNKSHIISDKVLRVNEYNSGRQRVAAIPLHWLEP